MNRAKITRYVVSCVHFAKPIPYPEKTVERIDIYFDRPLSWNEVEEFREYLLLWNSETPATHCGT